jgi:aryl-alcohol dehydrogenase-like predicted oxidoreductase
MQNQYSLVQREDEREMFPLLADQGVSSLPWCPLAKGRLARPYGQVTGRSASDPIGQRFFGDVDRPIVEAVHRIAATREVPMAQVALAWVLDNPTVAAPVIGATSSSHLDDAVAALAVQLDKAEIDDLESRYTPRQPTGF